MSDPHDKPAPMSNGERQYQYRARKKWLLDSQEDRLNTFISKKAKQSLKLLSRHYGLTQKAMLEKLLVESCDALSDAMEPHSPEWERFFQISAGRGGTKNKR